MDEPSGERPQVTAQLQPVANLSKTQAEITRAQNGPSPVTSKAPGQAAKKEESLPREAGLQSSPSNTRHVIKIPRSQRRGLLARLTLLPEVSNPYGYEDKLKWIITFIVAVAASAAPIGSGIILPVLKSLEHDFHASPTVMSFSVALYLLSTGIFPLWWSAFSEKTGRRTIFLTSFALFTAFAILAAESRSTATFIAMRMLSGGAAASVQPVGAATVADIWEPRERGRAMGAFYLGPLVGPLLGPIVGGWAGERWSWRATQWLLAIFGGASFFFLLFLLPETMRPKNEERQETVGAHSGKLLSKESGRIARYKALRIVRIFFIDPLKILKYLKYPAVVLTIYAASVNYGCLYILNISVQYIFPREPYHFSESIVGLLYIPNSIGYALASVLGGRWMDHIMKREALKAERLTADGELILIPEDRMRENAWLGALLYPSALVFYGWTADKSVFWFVPMFANFLYGIGSMLIFATATTILTEFMPQKSSAGVALNNLIRNFFSCAGAIVGEAWIRAIGNGWVFTIIGIWGFSTLLVIRVMRWKGPEWREKMNSTLR